MDLNYSSVSRLDVDGRINVLLSFGDTMSAEHGPFDHIDRQKMMTDGMEVLPMLLDDAKEGKVPRDLLERLKESILLLVRSLPLEWFTASVLKSKSKK